MHEVLNGSHITQDGLKYCQKTADDVCRFCGSSDGRFHRFWVCPFFAAQREHVTPDVWKLIPDLPDFLTGYGWSLRADSTVQWMQMLANQSSPPGDFPALRTSQLHLFTDGSCQFQTAAELRFASWAVVVASPDEDSFCSQVVDQGHLPGLLQSAYRAEIYAVIRAVQCIKHYQLPACLWTDCEGVVTKVRRLLQGNVPRPNSANSDLWMCLYNALLDLGDCPVSITHVAAHRFGQELSPLEEWCFLHNQWADRTAVRMNFARSPDFWALFSKHTNQVSAAKEISTQVQRVILSVSKAAVHVAELDPMSEREPEVLPDAARFWTGMPAEVSLADDAFRWYSAANVTQIFRWFCQTVRDSTHSAVWISQAQLYLDFQLSTGSVGLPCFSLAASPFRTRVRWFVKVLKEILRKSGVQFQYMYGLPESMALKFHTGTLALPWPPDRLQMIDRWILHHLPNGVRRVSSTLDALPLAVRDGRFPAV